MEIAAEKFFWSQNFFRREIFLIANVFSMKNLFSTISSQAVLVPNEFAIDHDESSSCDA